MNSIRSLDTLFDEDALHKAIGDRFNFDSFNAGTQDRVRSAQDALIRQLTADARDTIDMVVGAGVQTGLSAKDIAADIREVIGLTDTQARAVMNYRSMLQSLDPDVLRRQLRNDELDAAIREAMAGGQPLEDAFVERATRDYENNYLNYRARAISETESTRAANAGLADSYRQAVERGALPPEALTRFWQLDLDEKTCPICISIADLNPNGVAIDEPFNSADGPVDDSPVHPFCRCSVEYVTDLDQVPDEEIE